MNQPTTNPVTVEARVASALRSVLPFLGCLHASNVDEALAEARAALDAFDARPPARTDPAYVFVQEGGSSSDGLSIAACGSEQEALENRMECTNGAYRTSGVFEVSPALAAHGEELYELLESVLNSELEYSDDQLTDEEMDSDVPAEQDADENEDGASWTIGV